jgi:hypothetical protein
VTVVPDGIAVASVDGRTWTSGVVMATRVTVRTPRLWPIALAGFLARGGIAVLLLAIVPFPSAVGLANLVGPTTVTAAGLTNGAIVLLTVVVAVFAVLLVAGTGVGAATDAVLATAFDGPDEAPGAVPGAGGAPGPTLIRLTTIRLVTYVVLVVAFAVAAKPVYDALYAELTAPTDVATPLVARVVREAAGTLLLVALVWLLVEVVGGLAVRSAVRDGVGVGGAFRRAVGRIVRRPLPTLATTVLDLVGLIVLAAPLVASAAAWSEVRALVEERADPTAIAGTMVVLAATWIGALLVAAIASTWRGLLWSAEALRPAR